MWLGGGWLCRPLFVVQKDGQCCGGESIQEQAAFALNAPYDMVVSERHMYAKMDTEYYEYVIVLRRPIDRLHSLFQHLATFKNGNNAYNCATETGYVFAINCSFDTWMGGQPDNQVVRQVCGTRCLDVPKDSLTMDDLDFALLRLRNFTHILFLERFQETFSTFASKVQWVVNDTTLHRTGTRFQLDQFAISDYKHITYLDDLLYSYAETLYYVQHETESPSES